MRKNEEQLDQLVTFTGLIRDTLERHPEWYGEASRALTEGLIQGIRKKGNLRSEVVTSVLRILREVSAGWSGGGILEGTPRESGEQEYFKRPPVATSQENYEEQTGGEQDSTWEARCREVGRRRGMRLRLTVLVVAVSLLSGVARAGGGYPSPAETAANIINTVNSFIEDGDNKTLEETKEKTSEVKEITKDSSIDIEGFFVVVFIMFGPFILAYAIGYPIAVYSDHRTLVWREEEAWLKRRGGEPLNAKREILYPFLLGRSITEISEAVGKSRFIVVTELVLGTLSYLFTGLSNRRTK